MSKVAKEIEDLKNLEEFAFENNKIHRIPIGIGDLPRIRRLRWSGNRLPAEFSQLNEKNLINYLRELTRAESTRFNEAKLLLVGPGEVGKTFLLQALQGKMPKAMGSTKGVEIAREPLDLPHPTENGRLIHFTCWDFGGQEHYQITHQMPRYSLCPPTQTTMCQR